MSAMKIRAAAVQALEDRFGRVTPEKLIEAARDKKHPLHDDFEWDDKKAAHQHRLYLARDIIASVRVMITHSTKTISSVGYVRDPNAAPSEQGYVNVSRLRSEKDNAIDAVLSEVSRIQSLLERARELAIGLDLEDEFEAAMSAASNLENRLRRGPAAREAEREGVGA